MLFKIFRYTFRTLNRWILLEFAHHFNQHIQGLCRRVGIKSNFKPLIVILLSVLEDIIEDRCHHLTNDPKRNIEIILIAEKSQDNLLKLDVLVAIDIFSIMIHDKRTIHPSYFELKGILDKCSSDKIIVLSLKALINSS